MPKRFDHLDAKFTFKYEPVRYSIEITHVSFRGSEPAIALNALSGGVSVRNDTLFVEKLALRTSETSLSIDGAVQHYLTTPIFNLQISSDKTSLPEIARLVPALAGVRLQPAFELKLDGPADHLGVDMNVRSSAGQVTGNVVADVMAPGQSVTGDLSVRHLDLAPIPQQTGRSRRATSRPTRVDLHGRRLLRPQLAARHRPARRAAHRRRRVTPPSRSRDDARIDGRQVGIDVRAPRRTGGGHRRRGRHAAAEGASRDALAFDLHGRAQHVDLRRLPRDLNVPPAATNVNADYHVAGHGERGAARRIAGDLRFEPSTVAGARIAGGSTAGVTIVGETVAYRADATVADLDLQRVGEQFKVPALATDRYKSSINGHVVANGRGTTPEEMDVTASGTLTDTSILGGRIPQLAFDAALAQRHRARESERQLRRLRSGGGQRQAGDEGQRSAARSTSTRPSPACRAASRPTACRRNGKDQSRAVDDRRPRDRSREPSTATTRIRPAQIRTLEIAGRDVNVQASGTLALNETGQSNLKVHADTPSLEEIGKLVDQPLTGIGKVDATVTGNKRELQAAGNVIGDGVKYGDNGALTLSSDFTAKVPELTIATRRCRRRPRHVRDGRRAGHQRAHREDRLRRTSSSRSTRRRSSRSDRSAPPARCCCIPIIRKCTCSGWRCRRRGRRGKRARARSRRFSTRTTPSP